MGQRRLWLMIATRTVVVLLVLSSGLAAYLVLLATQPKMPMSQEDVVLPRVPVMVARPASVQRQWRGYGAAEAIEAVNVPARVAATVAQRPAHIQAGRRVQRGDLLIQLDAADFERQLQIAREQLTEVQSLLEQIAVEQARLSERMTLEEQEWRIARDELARAEELFERGAENRQGLDRARRSALAAERTLVVTREAFERLDPRRRQLEAQRAAQQAGVELAQLHVQRTRIVSPIDGVLEAVDVKEGEQVTMGQRVARVVDLRRIEVPLKLPAAARRHLSVGDPVRLEAASETGQSWDAQVVRIAPRDDEATRSLTLFAELEQPDALRDHATPAGARLLTPGLFVSGVVTSRLVEDRWVVPRRAVSGGRVRVVRDGLIRSRSVRVDYLLQRQLPQFDLPDDDQWAVLDDALVEGELVLVDGSMALTDGDAVRPVVRGDTEVASSDRGDVGGRAGAPGPAGEALP